METQAFFKFYNFAIYLLLFAGHAYAFQKESLKYFSMQGWAKRPLILFWLKTIGIIFWLIVPTMMMGFEETKALVGDFQLSNAQLGTITLFFFLAIVTGFSQVKNVSLLLSGISISPEKVIQISYIPLRILFLFAYEFWFRGILLFSLLTAFDMSWAILINVTLYAGLHAFSGKKEFLGSIFFGVILCMLSIWTESVWPAALIHLALSLSYELPVLLNKKKTA